MKIKSIRQLKNLKNKTVLVRCDFDLPLRRQRGTTRTSTRNNADKTIITDDSRLRAAVPTIKYLLQKGARVILMGHLGRPALTRRGRPGGKIVKEMSLVSVKERLEKILNKKINFTDIDEILRLAPLAQDKLGKLVMLENLRFNPGEEKNDPKFASKLAKLGDIYVNEAFAVSHRGAASVDVIKKFLPSYAGLNLEQEILHLSAVLNKPPKPLVAIIGGAKIETKLPVIKQFMKTADYILIGGGVANNFLKIKGIDVKKSLVDEKYLGEAEKILKNVKCQMSNVKSMSKSKCQIIIPIDWQVENKKILDIGPKTIWLFSGIIKKAKTIVWNGPMGYFEDRKFAMGTKKIAEAILANKKARIVVGGGETAESISELSDYQIIKLSKNLFISTGGGAMLEYLGGKKLPGLERIVK
jgi:phosphoglycerate kinase